MELPPQPTPSAIEVTCEDDPLTLEWEVSLGSLRRGLAVLPWGAASVAAVGLTLGSLRDWGDPGRPLATLTTAALLASTICILYLAWKHLFFMATTMGQARLVLHPDSLIWVAGGGRIPQVYRKSEVVGIETEPPGAPREVFLVVEGENELPSSLHLRGRFAPGDAQWLAGVLRQWRA